MTQARKLSRAVAKATGRDKSMRNRPLTPIRVTLPQRARGVMVALMALTPVYAAAQDRPPLVRREQTPQVLARYPDVALKLETPALQPGRKTYTTQAELETYIDKLPTGRIAKLVLGTTPGGRAVPALLFSREGAKTPAEVAALGRPVVWLIGQQHGNEPAGSEAMLALSRALADGELAPLLDRVSVVIIPRANPDGAAADVRDNLGGADINRDHGAPIQPETKLLHGLVRQLPPAVVIDAHEFTVGRRWVEALGGLQSVDMMLLSATHPMVPERVRALATREFQPAIEQAIGAHKLTSFVYHTMSTRAGERTISVGGNAPGIARNAFGLMGAVSFLLETRGVGIGLESYQRRVATHYIAVKAVLETAARLGPALTDALVEVRRLQAASQADILIGHTSPKVQTVLPLIDAVTGQDKPVNVDMLDTRVITAREERTRPAGYLVTPDKAAALAGRLEALGARTCTLNRALETATERYEIVSRATADRRAINPERAVQVRLHAGREMVASGTLYIPLDQPADVRLALALEPDAPGSLSALELTNGDGSSGMAIARVARSAMTPALAEAMVCGK